MYVTCVYIYIHIRLRIYIYIYQEFMSQTPKLYWNDTFFPACIIGIFQQHHVRREFGIHIALATSTKALDEACTLSPSKILKQQWLGFSNINRFHMDDWMTLVIYIYICVCIVYIHTDLLFLVDGDGIMIAACFLNGNHSSITPPQADYRAACPSKVYVLQSSPNYFSFKKSRLWWKP